MRGEYLDRIKVSRGISAVHIDYVANSYLVKTYKIFLIFTVVDVFVHCVISAVKSTPRE